ncbi:MAG TPA: transposase [Solirubrobacteraceae bacterium]|nr:transposase [Solirubrobacteraceae bacterium]
MIGRLPQSWTPPDHLLDLRARVKLRHTLSEQRSEWQQRIQAVLCHHGCPQRRSLLTGDGREWLAAQPLPGAAREQVTVALAMIDGIEAQIGPLDKDARAYAARQVGCKALQAHYGIGPAVMILAELGDCTRFSSSRLVVRYAGTDITMRRSDQRRAPGHLSRPGPPALRWALFEAAQPACRKTSQDRRYYAPAAQRLGHDRACLSVARKLLKRSYHTCASSARRHCSPHERPGARQAPRHTDRRGRLPACPCPPPPGGRP